MKFYMRWDRANESHVVVPNMTTHIGVIQVILSCRCKGTTFLRINKYHWNNCFIKSFY